jgi:ribosomal-protein-alanine N-acetyltransferase
MVLEAEGIDHPWVREEIKDLIDSDKKIALVAKEISVEDPVGYVGVTVTIDEAEIGNICVSGK